MASVSVFKASREEFSECGEARVQGVASLSKVDLRDLREKLERARGTGSQASGVGSHASKRNECHQPASQEPELVPSGRRDSPQLPAVEVAPECLVSPASGMRALIERWIDHQDNFSVEYVVKPACIHVILSGEVRQVKVWTLQYEKLTLATLPR